MTQTSPSPTTRVLEAKALLITGAGGIAAATAMAAAGGGAAVFIAGIDENECRELARQLTSIGGSCDFHVGDLTDPDHAQAATEGCLRRFGRIDGLFNVVGMSGRRFGDGPLHECTDDGWERTIDVNLKSAFLMSRAALPVMMAQSPGPAGCRGAILNMASVLALSPRADHFATHAYAASKGAIVAMTQSMAAYYASRGIRVNAVAPGLVRTPMSRRAQQDPAILELLKTKQPLREGFLEASDIAAAAVFLLSDAAGGITGITLPVDAGWCVSG